MRKIISCIVVLCLCICAMTSCLSSLEEDDPKPLARNFYEYFDTICAVLSYSGEDENAFSKNATLVEEQLDFYHKLFDIYHAHAGVTNVHILNNVAKDAPVVVDEELFDFLVYAKEMYTLTGGKVNVAMGSVLSLWHDTREMAENDPDSLTLPSDATLAQAKEHTNIESLILNADDRTVFFADPEMKLDVGALAKGYVTERVGQMLIERGVSSYVLNFGGNIKAIGARPSGAPWVTGITNPDKTSNEPFVLRINLSHNSLVTSGDYERYFVYKGEHFHHIIDPETSYPAKYFRSVSILTKDSALADALSTAFFCMTYDEACRMMDDLRQRGIVVDALFVDQAGDVKMSEGFRERICNA